MKISVYFLVAASAVVLLVLTPLSNADRVDDLVKQGQDASKNGYSRGNNREGETIDVIEKTTKENLDDNVYPEVTSDMKRAFEKGVRLLALSEDTIVGGIYAAKKVVLESPEAAKLLMNNAFEGARGWLFAAGIPFPKNSGSTVARTTNAARPGIESACKLILKAGFAVQDALTAAQSLLNQGIDAGGKAAQTLLDIIFQAVEIGYAAAYNNNQISVREAVQTLRNVQNAPRKQERIINENCTVAEKDPEASEALKSIEEAANKAQKRGANAELVNQFKQVLKCSLGDYLIAISKIDQKIEDIRKNPNFDPLAARQSFFKQTRISKESIIDLTAKIYSYLGEGAQKSGNQSSPKIDEVITATEAGKVKVFAAIETSGEFIDFGLSYKGDAFELAFKAVSKSTMYAKRTFIETLVFVAKTVFGSVL